MDTEFIEINFEDGSSARWAVDNPDLFDRAVLALCDVLGNPQTIKG